MRTLSVVLSSIVIMCLFTQATMGAVVVWSPAGNVAMGLTGLDVGGTFYDVDFVVDSYSRIVGGFAGPNPLPAFWNNSAAVTTAANGIVQAFSQSSPVPDFVTGWNPYVAIPYTPDTVIGIENGVPWLNQGVQAVSPEHVTAYAVFTEQGAVPPSVPLPGALILGLLGLASTSVIRNKRY